MTDAANGPLVLTIDMGTQSARALLVDMAGNITHKAQLHYQKPYYSAKPGWAEQSPAFYWDAVCHCCQALKKDAGSDWARIKAVTTSTIRDTVICLDKNLDPLCDFILWLDNRDAVEITDIPPTTSFLFSLARMKDAVALQRKVSACNWIAKNQPEIWAKTHKFVYLSAWLTMRLCGRLIDSVASTVGHMPFDSKTRGWMKPSDMRRAIFDITEPMQYELAEPGTILGEITPAAADATGIPQGLPLVATGSDKACETLGLGCLTPNKGAISFGTTSTIEVTTEEYLEPFPFIPPYPAVVEGSYTPEVEIYRGYWLVNWFKREFAAKEVADAARDGTSPEALLNARLKEVPPGCDGLLLQPYFTPGLVMPHARGAVIGFSDIHTRIHIYRAIVEGVNFALYEGLLSLQKRGRLRVDSLYVAGGGSQSNEICQITANQFGLPVHRTQTHEVTGVGSSLAAFVALGEFSSYAQAVAAMVHVKDVFQPDREEHKIYRQLFERVYCKVFDRLSPLYQEINEIISGQH